MTFRVKRVDLDIKISQTADYNMFIKLLVARKSLLYKLYLMILTKFWLSLIRMTNNWMIADKISENKTLIFCFEPRGHSFSTYSKFSVKVSLIRIHTLHILYLRKIICMYQINDTLADKCMLKVNKKTIIQFRYLLLESILSELCSELLFKYFHC